MIADIQKQLERTPFTPFAVRTSDGHEYSVPSVGHIHIAPRGTRVILIDDADVVSVLPILHISGVVYQGNAGS